MKGFCMKMRVSYSGYYTCLPSTRYGFDSRYPLQDKTFRFLTDELVGGAKRRPRYGFQKVGKFCLGVFIQPRSNSFYAKLLNETRPSKPARRPALWARKPKQKSFLFLLEEKNRRVK